MFGQPIRAESKHILPKEGMPMAKKFFDEYKGIFIVIGKGISEGRPFVRLACADDQKITVAKHKDGIYVNGEKYCTSWDEKENKDELHTDT